MIGFVALGIVVGGLFYTARPTLAWNHPTHTFITAQAWKIFQADNAQLLNSFRQYQNQVPKFYDKLVQGVLEADVHSTTVSDRVIKIKFGGRNYEVYMPTSEHYYEPATGRGALNYFRSAKTKALEYYDLALKNWREARYEDSIYNLGRAMHMTQDVTLPHHTYIGAEALLNQIGYSNWADQHLNEYKVESGGIYNFANIGALVHNNASVAHPLLKYVDGLNPWWIFPIFVRDDYGRAARTLLPLAQKTSAGLLLKYAQDVLLIEAAKQIKKAPLAPNVNQK